MKIQLEIKTHYGNQRIYALTHTQELQVLTGQKTLSKEHIKALEDLGFTFEVKAPDLNL